MANNPNQGGQQSQNPNQKPWPTQFFNSLLEFLLGSPMVFAAVWAFNDLLRKCGKRAVVENPLFD
jgi:hypothetical protein